MKRIFLAAFELVAVAVFLWAAVTVTGDAVEFGQNTTHASGVYAAMCAELAAILWIGLMLYVLRKTHITRVLLARRKAEGKRSPRWLCAFVGMILTMGGVICLIAMAAVYFVTVPAQPEGLVSALVIASLACLSLGLALLRIGSPTSIRRISSSLEMSRTVGAPLG